MPVAIALPRQLTCRGRPTTTETILIARRVSLILTWMPPGAAGYGRNELSAPCIEKRMIGGAP